MCQPGCAGLDAELGGRGYFPKQKGIVVPVHRLDLSTSASTIHGYERLFRSHLQARIRDSHTDTGNPCVTWGPDAPGFVGLQPDRPSTLQPGIPYLLCAMDNDGRCHFFKVTPLTLAKLREINERSRSKWAIGWNGQAVETPHGRMVCLYRKCREGHWHAPNQFEIRDATSTHNRCIDFVPGLDCRTANLLKHRVRARFVRWSCPPACGCSVVRFCNW